MKTNKQHLADAVRTAREQGEPKLSQEAMARALGVSVSTYQKWERGASTPGIDALCEIGRAACGFFIFGADGPMWEPDPVLEGEE